MTTTKANPRPDWDAAQWASIPRVHGEDAPPRWTLWQWASTKPRGGVPARGRGDSALSGGGHNPSGQRWSVGYRPTA